MPDSSTEPQEEATAPTPPVGRIRHIRIFLGRIKIGMCLVKVWIFRGGASRRQIYSVGERDSCEMRKLCGGHEKNKEGR